MFQTAYREIISKRQGGPLASTARAGLAVLAAGYGAAVTVRNRLYDRVLQPVRLPRPCISVGNLTVGGTGKTPLVAWLVHQLQEAGARVAILSRGYKGGAEGNDEQQLLQATCPGALCIADPDRIRAGRRAIEQDGSNVLILDDGFQHRRLARDLDIALVDVLCPDGYGHLLPRGLLREPFAGLRRADLVVLTRVSQAAPGVVEHLQRRCAALSPAPVIGCDHRPTHLVDIEGQAHGLEALSGAVVLAFAGIGNPDGFEATLSRLDTRPVAFLRFPDHHHYNAGDCQQISLTARRQSAEVIVTTEKDLVKLRPLEFKWPCQLLALVVRIDFVGTGGRILTNRAVGLLGKDQGADGHHV